MLLAVDIGNSRTKFGVYDGEVLTDKLSTPTTELADFSFDGLREIDVAIICSVVPEATSTLAARIRDQFRIEPTIVRNDADFGLTVLHTPLESIGIDRLVNCFSAVEKYDAPCIVCSIGTALTIDFVDADRVLRGGVIAPGMQMLAKALHDSTSQLPEVEIEATKTILQQSTVGALQSGVINGFIGLFECLIDGVEAETDTLCTVIATGGSAALVSEHTDAIDVVDENLLLDGLQKLRSPRQKPDR